MQKFKHTASKYAVVSALALFIMIFLWFFFNWSYVNFKGDILFNYSNKDKLTEFFTDNFYGTRACCFVFPLPFAFAINYLLYDEKVFYICRMKNRMQYITQCVLNIIAFSFICAFFHEAVSIICSYRIFGGELINELHIIKYCSLNFITISLYFVRVGGVFLLIRLFTNKKIAPYILFAVYVLEFYLSNFFGWLPVNDANIIENLIFENNMSAVIFAIIREISFAIIIIIFSYFKFQKKDILNNEKK